MDTDYYIASCSFGKDSLAMILLLMERNAPLDEVVFYDTGMEFQSIYNNRDKMKPILAERGIQFTEIHPQRPFMYDMLEKPVNGPRGLHYGYGWCGGRCRWGTTEKVAQLDRYAGDPFRHYVGIAADEGERAARLLLPKCAPLVEWGVTEKDALEYCYSHGWDWRETCPSSESGYVDLYSILDRVSCWCCANKNKKELRNMWRYIPDYWSKLRDLQSCLQRPMKRYQNKKYGQYGSVFELEKVFQSEGAVSPEKRVYDDKL